jgi:integral membrane protein (TIGR01906 family)
MKWLVRIFQSLLVLIVPFVILMTSVRIMLTSLTIDVEYRLPNVPVDSYGFTQSQRTTYAKLAVKYLTNSQGISFLADQTFPEGESLYNERELSHMLDVKILVQKMIIVWYVASGLILVMGLIAWRIRKSKDFWLALHNGGWATLILILGILVAAMINFDSLFTIFHRIFFTGDTWLFYYSDTLIRLFPMEFWLNMFIALGLFVILFSVFLIILGKHLAKRKSG